MKKLMMLRVNHIAGKCVEGCQIGTGNGGVPEEWG